MILFSRKNPSPINPSEMKASIENEMRKIVVEKFNFIYFPIPKVACTTLKEICYQLDQEKLVPESYDIHTHSFNTTESKPFFKFAFIRNPWDRLVSLYFNKIKNSCMGHASDHLFKNGIHTIFFKYGNRFSSKMTFTQFVESIFDIPDILADEHFRSQYLFISDPNKNLLVNFVGRFERFNEDLTFLKAQLKLPQFQIPHKMESHHANYSVYYNKKVRTLVQKRYEEDIELFNYNF